MKPPSTRDRIAALDGRIEELVQQVRGNRALDLLFYGASAAADHSLLWHGVGVAESLTAPLDLRRAARLAAIMGVESAIVNGAVKSMFRRERPPDRDRPLRLRQPLTSSFPSGHASAAFCAAAVLSMRRPRARPLWYAMAAVVSASRVYVGIHHPSDVIGGAAVGVVLGRAGRRALRRLGEVPVGAG